MVNIKKLLAGAMLTVVLAVGGLTVSAGMVADNHTQESNVVAELLGIPQTGAYEFSSTWWVTIEDADVTAVTDSALIWVGSLYQILKFIGLSVLIWVSVFIVNKIFSIAKIGS